MTAPMLHLQALPHPWERCPRCSAPVIVYACDGCGDAVGIEWLRPDGWPGDPYQGPGIYWPHTCREDATRPRR